MAKRKSKKVDTDETPERADIVIEAEGDDAPTPEPGVTNLEEPAESQAVDIDEPLPDMTDENNAEDAQSLEEPVFKQSLFENVLTAITQGPVAMDAFAAEHGYSLPEGPPYRKAKALAQWALD